MCRSVLSRRARRSRSTGSEGVVVGSCDIVESYGIVMLHVECYLRVAEFTIPGDGRRRMTMWRKSSATAVIALGVLAVALPAAAAPEKTAANGTLAIIPAVAANPAQQAIVIGFKKQAKKLGYPSVMLGGEFNPQ